MLVVCPILSLPIHDMNGISDLALRSIGTHDPAHTDIQGWTHTVEALCYTYGISDTRPPQFVKDELRTELEKVLADARARFVPIPWAQFKNFMTAFDRK